MARYIIRDREAGNPIEDADTLDEALDIVREYAQEDIADGNETDINKALSFYEVYDNAAQAVAWTNQQGTIPRSIDIDEFEEEATPVSCVRTGHGKWRLTVSFRGLEVSADTTNEDYTSPDAYARGIANALNHCGSIELDD